MVARIYRDLSKGFFRVNKSVGLNRENFPDFRLEDFAEVAHLNDDNPNPNP